MIRFVFASIVPFVALLSVGCQQGDHEHGAEPHTADGEGLPARSVTVWTATTELFMEYEPPIVGREG